MTIKDWICYIIAFIIVIATSLLGQYYTKSTVKSPWYDCVKPTWTPPGIVFPIVWTILYICIAIIFARSMIDNQYLVAFIFIINLIFNVLWCYTFFGIKKPKWALIYILMIWLSIILLLWFRRSDKISMILLVPYLLWISFAMVLNIKSAINAKRCN